MDETLALTLLVETFAVCRLAPDAELPARPPTSRLYSATRTASELSLVCEESHAPAGARCERGWRAFEVAGPVPFDAVGVLAALAGALANAGVSVFVVSTFDTDYLFVTQESLGRAIAALRGRGHIVGDAR